ncbi:MAG: hypothetical protein OEL56_00970 [Nitrosopumilus sp.]|nr:hypothetical protein [Nitrosopumilus sp.]MDH3515316.1 hypothetical protein [Nitrosopumilus sp.]MDH3564382.1 hypothetical protein [Nitrosopumilus sp.]MDH5417331.1 hypothetical protein [Nitrosopumilus sp.]MDH5554408.1 hypothetical protein [Nitrosopumilus sp.]
MLPFSVCLFAINVQVATDICEFSSKTAITYGVIEEARINRDIDIYGITVDLCSRIEKCAFTKSNFT